MFQPTSRAQHAGRLADNDEEILHVGVHERHRDGENRASRSGERPASAWIGRRLREAAMRSWSADPSTPVTM
jgi:hypothetical protein